MTGFGTCVKSNHEVEVTVEVRTLNGKALRVRYSTPKAFDTFLNAIDETVKKYIKRGEVNLNIRYKLSPDIAVPMAINYQEAVKYVKAADRIGAISGRKIDVSLRDLLSIPDIFIKEDVDVTPYRELFLKTLECALKELDKARCREGEKLREYFEEKLREVERLLKEIESQVEELEEKLFKKLKAKIEKLLSGNEISDDFQKRIELEVALIAEKQDVSEEISRLHAHIGRFRELLNTEETVGKALDFLCQEMHREINTLGNKIKEVDITEPIIKIKSEIAKMKEQVQNVE